MNNKVGICAANYVGYEILKYILEKDIDSIKFIVTSGTDDWEEDLVPAGTVNLHPSLLPYNRGKHPYYWSIVEGTPAGVSIHFITKNIDDGAVIYQREIETDITITGEELYEKSLQEMISLYKENHDDILSLNFAPIEQNNKFSTFHWAKDIEKHSKIDLVKHYKAIDLINIMRARTFKRGNSAYFFHEGEKYNIRIEISKDRTKQIK